MSKMGSIRCSTILNSALSSVMGSLCSIHRGDFVVQYINGKILLNKQDIEIADMVLQTLIYMRHQNRKISLAGDQVYWFE